MQKKCQNQKTVREETTKSKKKLEARFFQMLSILSQLNDLWVAAIQPWSLRN